MALQWKGVKQLLQARRNKNCCRRVKLIKLSFMLFTSLLLTNIITGLGYRNLTLSKQIRRAWSLLVLRPWKFFRLSQSNYSHQECRNISHSFQDAFNQTLIADASINQHEARSMSQLQLLLKGKFGILFSRRLHKRRYFKYRGRFRRALKMLEINVRMNYEPRVLQELVEMVKGPMDKHYKGLKYSNLSLAERYKTCAVVGNSGELLNTTLGSFIDSHEMVIRINNAKAKPFEPSLADFVGSKTTLMFMNSHILHQCSRHAKCFCHPYGLQVPIMLYLSDVEHMLDVAYCGGEHRSPIFLTDRRFDVLVAKIGRWYSIRRFFGEVHTLSKRNHWELLQKWEDLHRNDYHYSSGLQAVVLALGLCKSVSLFGFGKNTQFQHHFHTTQRVEHYGHDYEAEYLFYDDLERKLLGANPFLCETASYIPPVKIFHSDFSEKVNRSPV